MKWPLMKPPHFVADFGNFIKDSKSVKTTEATRTHIKIKIKGKERTLCEEQSTEFSSSPQKCN